MNFTWKRWNWVDWGHLWDKHTLKTGNEYFLSQIWTTLSDLWTFDLVSDDVITHTRTGTFDKGILQLFVLSTAKFWNVKPRVIRITWKGSQVKPGLLITWNGISTIWESKSKYSNYICLIFYTYLSIFKPFLIIFCLCLCFVPIMCQKCQKILFNIIVAGNFVNIIDDY